MASDDTAFQDPRSEAEAIIDSCIHCGLCMAACPTHQMTGDEREGPRGRIDLIAHMLESGAAPSREVQQHLDNCVPCWACMTPCPTRVNIRRLFDLAREHMRGTQRRAMTMRIGRSAPLQPAAGGEQRGLAARAAGIVAPVRQLFGGKGRQQGESLTPIHYAGSDDGTEPNVLTPKGKINGRVAFFFGCVEQASRPQLSEAAIRLLAGHGFEVVFTPDHLCCGGIDIAAGDQRRAREVARTNVDIWTKVLRDGPIDAIVTATPSCALRIREYGRLLGQDQGYAGRSERVGGLVQDITTFLYPITLRPARHWSGLKVAYHRSCAERHGLGSEAQPEDLLRRVGYSVTAYGDKAVCCGAAGFFDQRQPDSAAILRDRMVAEITADQPDILVSSDPACLKQLAAATGVPAVHTAELIDWTLGGPCPPELETVSENVHKVVRASAQPPSRVDETENKDDKRRWRRRRRSG